MESLSLNVTGGQRKNDGQDHRLCYYCKKKGHLIRDCRKRKWDERRETERGRYRPPGREKERERYRTPSRENYYRQDEVSTNPDHL